MQKGLMIILYVLVSFYIETLISQFFGHWIQPNLLIILIVFFNLFRGIRYSLFAAFFAGLLKDSYGVDVFGLHIFSFILCAYLTTFIKMYIYQVGSSVSRVLMVFLISTIHVSIMYILNLMSAPIRFSDMFVHILIPEVLMTTLITTYCFEKFRQCASKSFA